MSLAAHLRDSPPRVSERTPTPRQGIQRIVRRCRQCSTRLPERARQALRVRRPRRVRLSPTDRRRAQERDLHPLLVALVPFVRGDRRGTNCFPGRPPRRIDCCTELRLLMWNQTEPPHPLAIAPEPQAVRFALIHRRATSLVGVAMSLCRERAVRWTGPTPNHQTLVPRTLEVRVVRPVRPVRLPPSRSLDQGPLVPVRPTPVRLNPPQLRQYPRPPFGLTHRTSRRSRTSRSRSGADELPSRTPRPPPLSLLEDRPERAC